MLIGLSALSFSYRCGLVGKGSGRDVSRPLEVEDVVALAARAGLQSVEFPLAMLPDLAPARLAGLRGRLAACGLTVVVDSEVADPASLAAEIPAAAALGARVLRVLASPVLEGQRGRFSADWPAYLAEVAGRLRAARPLAEAHGVCLAVENHQDLMAEELAWLCEQVGGEQIGVTFDLANALVVGDEPLAAVERLGGLIRNVHLSDYMVFPSAQGWRVVRCALGEGDTNLRAFLAALDRHAPEAPRQIELVSHSARHLRILDDDWWQGYPPRDIRELLPLLRLLAQAAHPRDDDWRTPWERGAGEEQIAFYEDQQFASSVAYLRAIGALPRI